MPANPEQYRVEDDDVEVEPGDNIVIMNMCLVADMDLDLDSTVECTHYKPKNNSKVSLFKHIK